MTSNQITEENLEAPTSSHTSQKSVKFHVQQGITGIRDAIWIPHAVKVIAKSREAQTQFMNILIFNGIICLGSFLFFQCYILPYIDILYSSGAIENPWINIISYCIQTCIILLYYLLWNLPVLGLSFIINPGWLNTIAESAWQVLIHKAPPSSSSFNLKELPKQIASEMYANTFYIMFVLQACLCQLLPLLGGFLNIVVLSWLYSLYCFDFKWPHWTLSARLKHIEDNWAYFVGFGFVAGGPFQLAAYFLGFWVSYAVFWLLFPIFIISAIGAKNLPHEVHADGRKTVALFRLTKVLNKTAWNFIAYLIKRFVSKTS